jgi:hypothetical protein
MKGYPLISSPYNEKELKLIEKMSFKIHPKSKEKLIKNIIL